jgi:hypothetical protein
MNAYPPPRFVTTGVYRTLRHPIYVGFVMACLGASFTTASASGLWLVTPVAALGCAALVMGFEQHDLRRRFANAMREPPLLSLPPPSPETPTGWHRASIWLLVFVPWMIAFEAVYRLGVPKDAVEAYLPFERDWPVLQWTEAVYGSVYVLVAAAPFVARTRAALRHLALTGLIATAVVTLIYVTVPLVAPPRPFEPSSLLGHALMVERSMSHTVAAFPAFHVIWSLIAAEAWGSRSAVAKRVAWSWAALIAVSCLTTGMHAIADVLAAVAVFVVLRKHATLWRGMRQSAESVANSWREWRWGHVRLINHGLFAGLAGAVGFVIAASLAGRPAFWPLVGVHVAGLLGAGLWAQRLEGSPKLSRPFGYYGSVLGGVAAAIVIGPLTGTTMLLLAAIAVEAPWMQAIGRLRCLVQGCCHGSETTSAVGIRYVHPRSRVVGLANLRGVPLHPTPLYSILANVVIGVLLVRLWSLGGALSLIAGSYLILAGAARFVEESYRGEPQTPVVGGMRLYQWLAASSFVTGIVVTSLPSVPAPVIRMTLDVRLLAAAVAYGLVTCCAMGVDFPGSARRFARLAAP